MWYNKSMRNSKGQFIKGTRPSKGTEFKKGHQPWNKGLKLPQLSGKNHHMYGKHHTEESKKKMSESLKGHTPWNKGIKGLIIGYKFPKGHIPWNKGKKCLYIAGKNNPNWCGGITPINDKVRKSLEYKKWRKSVIVRDNYKCVICGSIQSRNNPMVVDHYPYPFSLYPDKRFDINNGRTLCRKCDDRCGFKWNRHKTYKENLETHKKALVNE